MLNELRKRLRTILPTDGPGHSDHPRIDIKTHRRNARIFRWMGILLFLVGLASFAQSQRPFDFGVGAAGYLLFEFCAMQFRLQAAEWELELKKEIPSYALTSQEWREEVEES